MIIFKANLKNTPSAENLSGKQYDSTLTFPKLCLIICHGELVNFCKNVHFRAAFVKLLTFSLNPRIQS